MIKKYINFILFVLIVIGVASLSNTIIKGLENGCDFQWHPAKLFWEKINHYRYFIDGGRMFMCQGGEYGHLLQVIFYPFVLVDWSGAKKLWLIINVFLTLLIPYLLCKQFKITNKKIILILLIFITCYPTRMTIQYGQQSLFVMFFLIMPFIIVNSYSFFFSGVSYVKYSTGYIIFLYYLVEKKFKSLFLAIIPIIFGWLIYFIWTGSDPIQNLFDPLELILQKNYFRSNDLYSLLNIYILNTNNLLNKFFIFLIILFLNLFFLFKIKKIQNKLAKISLIFLLPLIFMPHSNYDYVLLLPLLILGISDFSLNINKFNFYLVIYYFYFNRIIKHVIESYILTSYKDSLHNIFIFILFIFTLLFNLNYYNNKKNFRG
jgi:hypothetical protein